MNESFKGTAVKRVYRQKYAATGRDIAEKLREMASMVERGCIRVGPMELDLENRQDWSVKVITDEDKSLVSMKISWTRGVLAPEIDDSGIRTIEDDSELT